MNAEGMLILVRQLREIRREADMKIAEMDMDTTLDRDVRRQLSDVVNDLTKAMRGMAAAAHTLKAAGDNEVATPE